jgi:hypothetical protein
VIEYLKDCFVPNVPDSKKPRGQNNSYEIHVVPVVPNVPKETTDPANTCHVPPASQTEAEGGGKMADKNADIYVFSGDSGDIGYNVDSTNENPVPRAEKSLGTLGTNVLNALIAAGRWRNTNQIAKAVNLPVGDVLLCMEALLKAGLVERGGGPIYIWKAAVAILEEREGSLAKEANYANEGVGELAASMRQLEAAGVLIALCDDGSMRVTLTEPERRMLDSFTKRYGGKVEWKVKP